MHLLFLAAVTLGAPAHGSHEWGDSPFPIWQINLEAAMTSGDRQRFVGERRKVQLARRDQRRREAWVARRKELKDENETWVGTPVSAPPPTQRVTVQTVALTFQDRARRAQAGVPIEVEVVDKNNKVVDHARLTTTAEGKAEVSVKTFPSYISVAVTGGDWRIKDPSQTYVRLKGTEGRLALFVPSPNRLLAMNGNPASVLASVQQGKKKPSAPKGKGNKKPAPKPPVQKKTQRPVQTVTVRRRYDVPDPIVIEPTRVPVVVKTKPASSVFVGAEKVATADASGQATFTLPNWEDPGARPPIVVRSETECGTFDATLPGISPEAQESTAVEAPPLDLVAIKNVKIPGVRVEDLSVWASDVKQVFGNKPKEEPYREGLDVDGSKWWRYDDKGVWFKVREIPEPGKKTRPAVERIRIMSAKGGSVAGLEVGAPLAEVVEALGEGKLSDDPRPLGKKVYAEGGLLVKFDPDNKVEYFELRRPPHLLETGVDLGGGQGETRVYLPPIQGTWDSVPDAAEKVRDWLRSVPGVTFVEDPDEADFTVSLSIDSPQEKTDEVTNGIPYEYNCKVSLVGRIEGPVPVRDAKEDLQRVRAEGAARASFKSDVAKGAVLLIALAIVLGLAIKNQGLKIAAQLLVAAVGVAAIQKMPDVMRRASARAQTFALREATQQVANTLQRQAMFRVRVQSIDIKAGTLSLNAGRGQRLETGMEFTLANGPIPFYQPVLTGLKRDLYVARITDVSDNTATCRIFRITHSISDKMNERMEEKEQPTAVANILEPSTALPTATLLFRVPE